MISTLRSLYTLREGLEIAGAVGLKLATKNRVMTAISSALYADGMGGSIIRKLNLPVNKKVRTALVVGGVALGLYSAPALALTALAVRAAIKIGTGVKNMLNVDCGKPRVPLPPRNHWNWYSIDKRIKTLQEEMDTRFPQKPSLDSAILTANSPDSLEEAVLTASIAAEMQLPAVLKLDAGVPSASMTSSSSAAAPALPSALKQPSVDPKGPSISETSSSSSAVAASSASAVLKKPVKRVTFALPAAERPLARLPETSESGHDLATGGFPVNTVTQPSKKDTEKVSTYYHQMSLREKATQQKAPFQPTSVSRKRKTAPSEDVVHAEAPAPAAAETAPSRKRKESSTTEAAAPKRQRNESEAPQPEAREPKLTAKGRKRKREEAAALSN